MTLETIPYEAQVDVETSRRMCGAAALAMVYRSFGKEVTQEELFPKITGRSLRGAIHAKTYLLCRDALGNGFLGLVVSAREPWKLLQNAKRPGTRTIVNHRIAEDSPAGHYSVVVDVDEDGIVLHDPRLGPERRVARDAFLRLWQPHGPRSEIAGYTAVVVTSNPMALHSCPNCSTMVPMAATCEQCKKVIPIHPGLVLGCALPGCGERTWAKLFCPYCDAERQVLDAAVPFPKQVFPSKEKRAKMSPDLPTSLDDPMSKLKALLNGETVQSLDAVSRERLNSAVENIESLAARTKEHLTRMASDYQAKADELAQKAEQLKAVAAEKEAQAAAARAAAAIPPAPPPLKAPAPKPPKPAPPKLSPETGQKLRAQLLGRFGKGDHGAGTARSTQEFNEEWKDWLESGG